ncbi:hypothetical protein [uncultured Bacteroides sp.]|uniref:hypothetical protein n=1 Tax=uncultured Bacteroides sp. TaxID=162156 RepID=UPI00258EA189|nr:hypothetical protein [uncultured Bacteroides sp.]
MKELQNMKTPLFLADKYCLSLDELKANLYNMAFDDTLYTQIIAAVSDGIISKWLEDGSSEEKKYAATLNKSLDSYKDPAIALNRLCVELNIPTILK